jgi:hypothetical protein
VVLISGTKIFLYFLLDQKVPKNQERLMLASTPAQLPANLSGHRT